MKKKSSTKKHNTLSAEKKAQRKEEVQKQKRKSIRKRVLIGAIAVVLLGGAATGTIVVYHDDAIMTHARTAMKSDHYRVSQAMMSYYLKRMYNTYLNYYSADTLKSSYGLDVTKRTRIDFQNRYKISRTMKINPGTIIYYPQPKNPYKIYWFWQKQPMQMVFP